MRYDENWHRRRDEGRDMPTATKKTAIDKAIDGSKKNGNQKDNLCIFI